MEQMAADERGQFLVADFDSTQYKTSRELMNLSKQLRQQYPIVEEEKDDKTKKGFA